MTVRRARDTRDLLRSVGQIEARSSRAMCGLVNFTIPRVMLIEGTVRMRFVAVPNQRPRLEEVTQR